MDEEKQVSFTSVFTSTSSSPLTSTDSGPSDQKEKGKKDVIMKI